MKTRSFAKMSCLTAGLLMLAACGTTPGERALTGGALGAAGGAAIGAAAGGNAGTGALIGGAAGAIGGAATTPQSRRYYDGCDPRYYDCGSRY